MLVGDIYSTDYGKIGLKSSVIASSFSKVFKIKRQAKREAEDSGGLVNGDSEASNLFPATPSDPPFSAPDISRSLLYAILII